MCSQRSPLLQQQVSNTSTLRSCHCFRALLEILRSYPWERLLLIIKRYREHETADTFSCATRAQEMLGPFTNLSVILARGPCSSSLYCFSFSICSGMIYFILKCQLTFQGKFRFSDRMYHASFSHTIISYFTSKSAGSEEIQPRTILSQTFKPNFPGGPLSL